MEIEEFSEFLSTHPEIALFIASQPAIATGLAVGVKRALPRKVIFLDVDEVFAGTNRGVSTDRINRTSVDLINRLAIETNARIVYVSIWGTHHSSIITMSDVHEAFGFASGTLHHDYRIDPHKATGMRGRGDGVSEWLTAHPDVKDYVIIDDSYVCYEHIKELDQHSIPIDAINGFTNRDYEMAKEILDRGQITEPFPMRRVVGCLKYATAKKED